MEGFENLPHNDEMIEIWDTKFVFRFMLCRHYFDMLVGKVNVCFNLKTKIKHIFMVLQYLKTKFKESNNKKKVI